MAASSDAVVIGAGIAGASTALALRRRGLEVTLLDFAVPNAVLVHPERRSRDLREHLEREKQGYVLRVPKNLKSLDRVLSSSSSSELMLSMIQMERP